MENFTPFSALFGGVLIGVAATMLLVMTGRVAGISGIAAALLRPQDSGNGWRVAFLLGVLAAPVAYVIAGAPLPPIEIEATPALLVVAGLLVGIGTRMGGGCTSGHGVCGIARGSARSIAATGIFVAVAMVTVFVMNLLG
jgi:uncharacterized protein